MFYTWPVKISRMSPSSTPSWRLGTAQHREHDTRQEAEDWDRLQFHTCSQCAQSSDVQGDGRFQSCEQPTASLFAGFTMLYSCGMQNIKAAAVQFEPCPGDKRANLETIVSFAEQAADQKVQLLAFPECCITGYWFLRNLSRPQLEDLAERVPDGPSTRRLLDLSRKHGMTLGAGLIESDGQRLFNSYVVAMPDGQWR